MLFKVDLVMICLGGAQVTGVGPAIAAATECAWYNTRGTVPTWGVGAYVRRR